MSAHVQETEGTASAMEDTAAAAESDRRLLFSQSLLSFLGLLLRAALRPGNRPCTGEVPVPDKDGRRGGPCAPPHPSKTDPPLPPLCVLVQAATLFSIAPSRGRQGAAGPAAWEGTGLWPRGPDWRRFAFPHPTPLAVAALVWTWQGVIGDCRTSGFESAWVFS